MTPIYKVVIDGQDITAKIKPFFVSLTIDDKEGEMSDSCQLVLVDDASIALPPKGKSMTVWIGYQGGQTAKYGPYIIDYAKQSGPPDQITLMAHGANLRDQMKVKKRRHFDDITLKDLVATIAAEYDLKPNVHEDFADIVIPYLPQDNINDLVLLKKLAWQYGAIVKPEGGQLIFMVRGLARINKQTPVTINKTQTTLYSVHLPDRYRYGSVTAKWYDVDQAKYSQVTVGEQSPEQVLTDIYSSEPEAYRAAKAEKRLIKKMQGQFRLTMPMMPSVRNETPARLGGFKPEIDLTPWVLTRVKHTINDRGATTTLNAEIQPVD